MAGGRLWSYLLVALGFILVAAATVTPWVHLGPFSLDAFDSYSEMVNLVLVIGALAAGLCLRSRAKLGRLMGWAAAAGAALVIVVASMLATIDPDSVITSSGGLFNSEMSGGPGPILAVIGVAATLSGLIVFARAGSPD